MSKLLKTIVVDDNEVLARKFSTVVNQWEEAKLVGCFFNIKSATEFLQSNPVDLMITDLKLPDGSGVSLIKLMFKLYPDGHSIVISALNERSIVVEAITAGAVGYLSKEDSSFNLLKSLKSVIAGDSPISVNIARHILMLLQNGNNSEPPESSDVSLTARETEILSAISKGYTYREIAKIYNVSHQTVPVHVRNIYRKLHVKNRSEASYEAMRLGLIDP